MAVILNISEALDLKYLFNKHCVMYFKPQDLHPTQNLSTKMGENVIKLVQF